MPGTDPDEAVRLVLGELPDLPHLPELPARGPGAAMIGRSATLLVDLPVEIGPSAWRVAARAGRDLRNARDLLARDLDALQRQAPDYAGPLKLQVAGPWTLAAGIELASGHRILTDHGATRDLIASLAEGVRAHLADVAARVPGATLILQLDEPSLPAVLSAALPTASGYGTVRSIDGVVAEEGLRAVLDQAPAGGRAVHCCAPGAPIAMLARAGADCLSVDESLLVPAHYDAIGQAIEDGAALWAGVVPTSGEPNVDAARARLTRLWQALGFPAERAATSLVPTPACGLAGSDLASTRLVLTAVRELGRSLL